jgi:hypothetical protein
VRTFLFTTFRMQSSSPIVEAHVEPFAFGRCTHGTDHNGLGRSQISDARLDEVSSVNRMKEASDMSESTTVAAANPATKDRRLGSFAFGIAPPGH